MRGLSRVLHWDISVIRERVRLLIAGARDIAHLLVDVRIERLNVEDDTIVVEGTYRYIVERGRFRIEFEGSTLDVRRIEIE